MNRVFFFSSRRRHTRYWRDWSSDVCSSDLIAVVYQRPAAMDTLNPVQVIRDLGFQYGVDRIAEVMTKQHILGGNGGIGLQFEDPMPIRLSIAKQSARCRRDARLQGTGLNGDGLVGGMHLARHPLYSTGSLVIPQTAGNFPIRAAWRGQDRRRDLPTAPILRWARAIPYPSTRPRGTDFSSS